jgi:hypothetical protein
MKIFSQFWEQRKQILEAKAQWKNETLSQNVMPVAPV